MPKSNMPTLDELWQNRSYMFYTANGFHIAWQRCHIDIPISPNAHQSLGFQAATCGALSVEIYLKLLLVLSSIDPGSKHKLNELFNDLPDVVKDKVKNRYKSYAPWGNIEVFLEDTKNYFVERRYVYEMIQKGSFTTEVNAFGPVIKSLHNMARELDPGLQVTGDDSPP